ncbi:ABC transporter ATP-binding protein [Celeribacter halophilus]|jgi:peptide/nickel transport system ATP-binding protein|uniref:ABC transporter ATP-binding protein n=1 Tax=Celeribacter halophilus TaxID=576117 RepID=A0AAW7Y1V8_9RHOB|nr:ABC transporter ATP-binding protein [Celeribacter halophilus]MDO6459009.1 ABC transporter ATP-binding protein [Celeribacter halophilus]
MNTPLLSVKDLTVQFRTPKGPITAVDGIDLTLERGEVLGIIGESGSGKSVTMRALMRILPEAKTTISGDLKLDGKDVLSLKGRDLASYRGGDVSMVFQEPATALDPVYTIGTQITETVRRHRKVSRTNAQTRALEMLELVRIPSPASRLGNYPHEMSGGMRQRAMIALALAAGPKLLLADEPTTALDATVQIQVILLLRELQKEIGMATIFVTHDVGVAAEISDRIAVMYAGRIVETGTAAEVLKNPKHPYTQGLLSSTVQGAKPGAPIKAIPGMPPDLAHMPAGCAFAPRCPFATSACQAAIPELLSQGGQRRVACIRLEEFA